MSAVKTCFDLLHLSKDPFHYKSGTLDVIRPINQEAISKRGGRRGGSFKGHVLTVGSWCGGGVPLSSDSCESTEGAVFPVAGFGDKRFYWCTRYCHHFLPWLLHRFVC